MVAIAPATPPRIAGFSHIGASMRILLLERIPEAGVCSTALGTSQNRNDYASTELGALAWDSKLERVLRPCSERESFMPRALASLLANPCRRREKSLAFG